MSNAAVEKVVPLLRLPSVLPVFQEGQPSKASVYVMPKEVADHVEAAGRELHAMLTKKKGGTQ